MSAEGLADNMGSLSLSMSSVLMNVEGLADNTGSLNEQCANRCRGVSRQHRVTVNEQCADECRYLFVRERVCAREREITCI